MSWNGIAYLGEHMAQNSSSPDAEIVEMAHLARIADVEVVEPGTVLSPRGALGPRCVMIASGEAGVYLGNNRLATAGPGDFVGEFNVLSHRPRSAVVRAVTPMEVYVVTPVACRGPVSVPAVNRASLRRLADTLGRL
jgi:CRP-like cAMP-binding protein